MSETNTENETSSNIIPDEGGEESSHKENNTNDNNNNNNNNNNSSNNGSFECNICFDDVTEPVVTQCGHLFCWPCIFQWLNHNSHQQCPVCKSPVTEEKLIPIYGRGGTGNTKDPRKNRTIPQRPPGRPETRTHTTNNQQHYNDFFFGGGGGGNGIHTGINNPFGGGGVSFGFGLFPGLFGFQFYNSGGNNQQQNQGGGNRMETDLDSSIFLSRVVFGIGLLILFFVLFN